MAAGRCGGRIWCPGRTGVDDELWVDLSRWRLQLVVLLVRWTDSVFSVVVSPSIIIFLRSVVAISDSDRSPPARSSPEIPLRK